MRGLQALRLVAFTVAIAFLVVGQVSTWASIGGRDIPLIEVGFGLSWQLAALITVSALTTVVLSGRRQLALMVITTGMALFAGYVAIAALRSTPTIAAVHYGADASAGPALPLCLLGIVMLTTSMWANAAQPQRRTGRSDASAS